MICSDCDKRGIVYISPDKILVFHIIGVENVIVVKIKVKGVIITNK